jgi:membrane protein required for colicin V production
MIYGVAWADVVIFAAIAFTTWRGYARGFIGELAGIVALIASIVVPWYYNGVLDAPIHNLTGMATPIAHFIGMAISGIAAYLIILLVARAFGRIKKVPVLGLGNAMFGAGIGLLKGAILVWLVLFVGLFFPLTVPIRSSLHHSRLAAAFTSYDPTIDRAIESTIPLLVRPLVMPFFNRHHV